MEKIIDRFKKGTATEYSGFDWDSASSKADTALDWLSKGADIYTKVVQADKKPQQTAQVPQYLPYPYPPQQPQLPQTPAGAPQPKKEEDNTGLYIGIGSAVLVLIVLILVIALKR